MIIKSFLLMIFVLSLIQGIVFYRYNNFFSKVFSASSLGLFQVSSKTVKFIGLILVLIGVIGTALSLI